MLDSLTIVTHTHTDCRELWNPYFDSYEKFFNHNNHIVLINEFTEQIPHKQIVYSDTTKYSDRVLNTLVNVPTPYTLLDFEDMFLYDNVNVAELERIIEVMDHNSEIFYTRLIKSGIRSSREFQNNLFAMDAGDFLFSLTPTIWKPDQLCKLLHELQNLTIWELEVQGSALLSSRSVKALYYFDNSKTRGGHYDSTIYPHICSAILKGKWNLSEYSDVLLPIIQAYKINIDERGIC